MSHAKLIAEANALIAEYRWLSPKEYAESRGLTVRSVYRAIRAGRLPYPVEHPTGTTAVVIRVPAHLA